MIKLCLDVSDVYTGTNIYNMLILAYIETLVGAFFFLMIKKQFKQKLLLWPPLKNMGSEIFFLDFLWWSDCYIFSSYVFLIVANILRSETLWFNFVLPLVFPL